MKHLLTLIFALTCALTSFADAKQVPYSSNMANDSDWEVVNLTEGSKTWAVSTTSSDFSGSGATIGYKYTYDSSYPADDWIISPPIHLEAGKKYQVQHWGKISNVSETYSFHWADSKDTNTLVKEENTIWKCYGILSANSGQTIQNVVEPKTTGDYYFGIYVFSPKNAWYTYVTAFSIEEYNELPGTIIDLKATPGDQGALEATLSWTWPTLNNLKGELDSPITGFKVYRYTSSYFTPSDTYKVGEITLDTPEYAGEAHTWKDDTFTEGMGGKTYYYFVVASTAYGDAPNPSSLTGYTASVWVGPDSGVGSLSNLSVKLDEDNPNHVLVNFDRPKGKNGGWIDQSKIGFNIFRYNGSSVTSGTYVQIADNYQGDLPFKDTTIEKLGKYSYGVKIVVDGVAQTGNNTSAGTIVAGPTPTIPYSETFDNSTSLDVFTTFKGTATNSMNTWSGTSVSSNYAAYVNTGSYYTVDSWLVTPGIQMTGGKTYVVKFDSWGSCSSTTTEYGEIYVYFGKGTTLDDFNNVEPSLQIVIDNSSRDTKEARITVAEDGIYNVAFRDYATGLPKNYSYVYLDDLKIEELPVAPAAPENLQVTVDNQGAYKVTLNWNNPTKANDGTDLPAITEVQILRSGEQDAEPILLETLTGQTPGEAAEFIDETITTPGIYTYILKPYLNGYTYDFAEITTPWVGPDALASVSDVIAVMSPDDYHNILISFNSVGANGGYINHEEVSYKVTRKAGNSSEEIVVKDGLKYSELPFEDTTAPELNAYTYKVYVKELDGDKGTESNKMIGGGVAEIPYSNTFDSMPSLDLFTKGHSETTTRNWDWSLNAMSYTRMSSTNSGDNDAWIITPPFDLASNGNYSLAFKTWVTSAVYPKGLKVYLTNSTDPSTWNNIIYDQEIDVTTLYAETPTVDFSSDNSGVHYLVFRVNGSFTDTGYIYVDEVKLERTDRAPLAVENLTVKAGDAGAMTATLTWTNPTQDNKGDNLSKIDKVVVLRDNREVGTVTNVSVGGESTFEDSIDGGTTGFYNYTAVAYLDDVPGAKVEAVMAWIGPDELTSPKNVKAFMNYDGYPEITFDGVTEGKNGGYVNVDAIRYRVYRNNVMIAEDVASTAYVDESSDLTVGTTYTYAVSAYIDGNESDKSGSVSLKYNLAVSLPYEQDFSSSDNFASWELDKWTWQNKTNTEEIPNLRAFNNNILAVSTPFKAQAGTINVSYELVGYATRYTEEVEVYLLTNINDLAGGVKFNDIILTGNNNTGKREDYSVINNEVEIENDGVYYIGFKVVQNGYASYLLSLNVTQTSIVDPNIPASPTSVNVTLNSDGGREISFDAVTGNSKGQPLENITYNIYLDGTLIKEGLQETSYTDSSKVSLAKHVYSVKAMNGEYEGKLTESDPIVFGEALTLPYKPDFSTADDAELWSSLNGNFSYSKDKKAIDVGTTGVWAVTPPFKAERGTLTLTYMVNGFSGLYDTDMKVYLIKDLNAPTTAEMILSKEDIYSSFPEAETQEITISAAGVYYLGFEMVDGFDLYINQCDIEQTSVYVPAAPKAPATVTASINDDGSRIITFEAVTEDLNQNELSGVTYNIYRNDELLTENPILTTSFTDNETDFTYNKFVYSVEALWEDFIGEKASANPVYFGDPFDMEYPHDASQNHELWSVNGANGWQFDETAGCFYTDEKETILLTPPLDFKEVNVQIEIEAHGTTNNDLLHVFLVKDSSTNGGSQAGTLDIDDSQMQILGRLSLTPSKESHLIMYEPIEGDGGRSRIGFVSEGAEGSTVKLYTISIKADDSSDSSFVNDIFNSGKLFYDNAMCEIKVPGEGSLEVLTLAGVRVVRVATNSAVNISGLAPGVYVAQFIDACGNVYKLKFKK